MRRWVLLLCATAACGRLDFDPVEGSARCAAPPEPNDSTANATPLAVGGSASGILCQGDVDVYALPVVAGAEIDVALTASGPGWPTIELVDDTNAVRAVKTLERTNRGVASHDGTMFVRIAGKAGSEGVTYTVNASKHPGRHLFIAPNGNDSAAGDFATPWQHFDVSLLKLQPGDTLVAKDGVYTVPQNGRFKLSCGGGAGIGTADAPIRVVAMTERQAEVQSDGLDAVVDLEDGCAYWEIEGFHLENQDNAGATGSTAGESVELYNTNHVTVRRMLGAHNNRYTNSHMFNVDLSSDVLVEDVEAYDYHRGGVIVYESQNVVVRRSFTASRGYADIAGGYASTFADKGDEGIALALSTNVSMENAISVGNGVYSMVSGDDINLVDARALGSISLEQAYGWLISLYDAGSLNNSMRTTLENCIAVTSEVYGFYVRSNMDFRCTGCTASKAVKGFIADQLTVQPRVSSASCTNCLSIDSTTGFEFQNQTGGWSLVSPDAFGTPTPFTPASAAEIMNPMQRDPQLGGCLVYQPANAPLRGAGANGGTIGGEVVYRYKNGVLTDVPLWDPETGVFPCGAVVPGVNDDPATSCIGIHQRLHVGTPDCPLPYPAL